VNLPSKREWAAMVALADPFYCGLPNNDGKLSDSALISPSAQKSTSRKTWILELK
jgi:hypothetical protein